MTHVRAVRWLLAAVAFGVVIAAVYTVARDHGSREDAGVVDIGFARDMAVHHTQAVLMAEYAREHAPTAEIRSLASSIAHEQQLEFGQLLGWLEAWGQPRTSGDPPMTWMRAGGAGHEHRGRTLQMPGMATPAEMDALVNMRGNPLELRFLQLMIRHHQGGIPMAADAARRATHGYVRSLARQMAVAQRAEVDRMMQLLRDRGGKVLPAP